MRTSHGISSFVCAVALASCSHAGSPLPAAPQAVSPELRESAGATRASITLLWKAPSRAISHGRSPHFISPSAQSIQIEVSAGGAAAKQPSTIVNRPQTGTQSIVTMNVPAGSDVFLFSVFDKKNAAGTNIGGAQVTKTIAPQTTTKFGVTLDGYVQQAVLTPSVGKAFLKTRLNVGGGPGYTLVGSASVELSVTFMDADGNVIVPSQANAYVTLASSQPSLIALHRLSPQSNSFTIRAMEPNPEFTPVTIELQVSSGSSGSQQFFRQFSVQEEALLVAAASGKPGSIVLFDQEGNVYHNGGTYPGLKDPVAVAWDPYDNALFVGDSASQAIYAYDETGNPLKGWTAPHVPGINSVTFNHDARRVYAVATKSSGAARSAILAFDLSGHAVRVRGFKGASAPVSIAYNNTATMNNPAAQDGYCLLSTLADGTAVVAEYSPAGARISSLYIAPSSFTPVSVTPFPPTWVTWGSNSVGGTGQTGCLIPGNFNGQTGIYVSSTVSPIVTGSGTARTALVDPLFDYYPGLNIDNQTTLYYADNASGGLIAINGVDERDASLSFHLPSGASSFTALDVTY
jgi:hypothetical protein